MRIIMAIAAMMFLLIPATVLGEFWAFGQKANYADACPTIEYETDNTISVGVHDQRPYIINGEKTPNYVGTARTLYGVPWNMNTHSNKPLSDDIASAVVSGFKQVGIKAVFVPIPFSDDSHTAIEKLKKLGTKNIAIITLREWKIDKHKTFGFFTDTVLRVFDGEGKELAKTSVSHKNMGSGDGSIVSADYAARLYLSMLLNDPNIKTALGAKSVSGIRKIGQDGRFIAYSNGTVQDTRTKLMWASRDNGGNINWQSARSYCEDYRGGGYTDWRMPTQDELAELYDDSKIYKSECGYDVHITALIRITGIAPWASETRGSNAALFSFDGGDRNWYHQSYGDYSRALPVRSDK